jgi:hypothetical protein
MSWLLPQRMLVLDRTAAQGAHDCLAPIVDLQLGESVRDVVAHHLLADGQLLRDLPVAQALRDARRVDRG